MNLEHLSDLISEIESDDKEIPVLLKQYLKLGGQVLGFNVDAKFNHTLDGLIMVDLLHTEPKVLAKYMGKAEQQDFYQYHRPPLASVVGS